MSAREVDFRSELWGERARDLRPLLRKGKSDSGSLDNVFELLVRSGRSLAHAKEMLIPAAWENVADLGDELTAFYEYHAVPDRAVGRPGRHRCQRRRPVDRSDGSQRPSTR